MALSSHRPLTFILYRYSMLRIPDLNQEFFILEVSALFPKLFAMGPGLLIKYLYGTICNNLSRHGYIHGGMVTMLDARPVPRFRVSTILMHPTVCLLANDAISVR